jgi:Glycosyl transferase family 2
MDTPRFSVVIPTRERAPTLRYCLRTCLDQDFDDYEIVVCDNCGSPATREVVDEAASPRIRYLRSPEVLSMSSNWDLAVAQARGDYVLVLGDDDGLLRHALREVDGLIRHTGARAVRWAAVHYTWPNIALAGQANALRIPLSRQVRTVEGCSAIADAIAFRVGYATLPMLYNAAVHRDLLAALREKAGRLFPSLYPDVYSGFALAWLAGSYLSVELPMMVAGSSGGSYGVATLFLRGRSPLDCEYRSLNARERLLTHPWVPDLAGFPHVPVADSFLLAKQLLFPDEKSLQLDRRMFATACVRGIRADGDVEWRAALAQISQTLADDLPAQQWFDSTFGDHPFTPAPPFQIRSPHLGFDGDCLHLDAQGFGVADVYGAVQLCQNILGTTGGPIRYGLQSHSVLEAARGSAQMEADQARQESVRLRGEAALARDQAARVGVEAALARDEAARVQAAYDRYRSRLPNRILDKAWRMFKMLAGMHHCG